MSLEKWRNVLHEEEKYARGSIAISRDFVTYSRFRYISMTVEYAAIVTATCNLTRLSHVPGKYRTSNTRPINPRYVIWYGAISSHDEVKIFSFWQSGCYCDYCLSMKFLTYVVLEIDQLYIKYNILVWIFIYSQNSCWYRIIYDTQ